ncbi:hypothetical protein GCM10010836_22000 [Aminobacter aminovorans]
MIAAGTALGGDRHGKTQIFGIAPHGGLPGMPIRGYSLKGRSPGFYPPRALGSCPAMGIKLMAAQRGA